MSEITVETLEKMQACRDGRKWFSATFPNGATLEEAWDTCPRNSWRVWFALRNADHAELVKFARDCATRAATYATYATAAYAATDAATDAAAYADAAAAYVTDDAAYATAYAAAAAAAAADAADVTAYATAARERGLQVGWARAQLFG